MINIETVKGDSRAAALTMLSEAISKAEELHEELRLAKESKCQANQEKELIENQLRDAFEQLTIQCAKLEERGAENERLKDENNAIKQKFKLGQRSLKEKAKEIRVLEEQLRAGNRQLNDARREVSWKLEAAVQDFGSLSKLYEDRISSIQARIDEMSEKLSS